jgi:hypothetical protein
MRLVRPLLATAALSAVLLAGCSSRPDDPTTTAAEPAGQPASPAAAGSGDPGDLTHPKHSEHPNHPDQAQRLQ